MKPVYVKKNYVWLGTLVTGIMLMLVGIVQMGVGLHAERLGSKTQYSQTTGEPIINETQGEVQNKSAEPQSGAPEQPGNGEKKQLNISEASPNAFFAEYRLERDRTRSQQIDLLREIVNNQNSAEEARKEAQRRILSISQSIDTEMKLENLVIAENIKDCVAFIQDKSATVIVQVPVLTTTDKNKIQQIAARVTGLGKENIIIIPKA